jgi:hypothetical protein
MIWTKLGNPREKRLAAVAASLLLLFGASELWRAGYVTKRLSAEAENARLTHRLLELERLNVRSEEIRRRYKSLSRGSSGAETERRELAAEELLGRLEEAASRRVHLVAVRPEPPATGQTKTKLSLELIDSGGRLDDFLEKLLGELSAEVQTFQATVSGEEDIRCQATILFPTAPRREGGGETQTEEPPAGEGSVEKTSDNPRPEPGRPAEESGSSEEEPG